MRMKFKDKHIIFCIFSVILYSCTCKSDLCLLQHVDKQCKEIKINNIFIAFRSQEWFSGISCLMVSDFLGSKPPYVIKYDSSKDSIYSISDKLLVLNKASDYLTKLQIIEAVKLYNKIQVTQLGIDKSYNIYIKQGKKAWVKVEDKERIVGNAKRNVYSNWYEIE